MMSTEMQEMVAGWDMTDRMLWAQEGCDKDEQQWRTVLDIAGHAGMQEAEIDGADSDEWSEEFEELIDLVAKRWDAEYEEFCKPHMSVNVIWNPHMNGGEYEAFFDGDTTNYEIWDKDDVGKYWMATMAIDETEVLHGDDVAEWLQGEIEAGLTYEEMLEQI